MSTDAARNAFRHQPQLGIGVVRHHRLRPVDHAFDYPTWFVTLPLRSLRREPSTVLARNRGAWVSFHDSDHGDGRADCLEWIEQLLAGAKIADADGEIWLQTYPRVLGYVFKPVSFWFCHRQDGSLTAVVAEVNNTFGERHCYLLPADGTATGAEMRAAKVFHVSPFCAVSGGYRFRFLRTDETNQGRIDAANAGRVRSVARIDYDDDVGPLLATSISGTLAPLTRSRLRSALLRMPLLTFGVIVRIHWHALRLWLARVPLQSKPDATHTTRTT